MKILMSAIVGFVLSVCVVPGWTQYLEGPPPVDTDSELVPTTLNTESLLVEAKTVLKKLNAEVKKVEVQAGSAFSIDAREALDRYYTAREVTQSRLDELKGSDATQIERDRLNTALEDLKGAFEEFRDLSARK